MPILAECPSCRFQVNVPEEHAGKRGRCPRCKEPIRVPSLPAAGEGDGDLVPLDDEPPPGPAAVPLATARREAAVDEEDAGVSYDLEGRPARRARAPRVRREALSGVGVSAAGVSEAAAATTKTRTAAEVLAAFGGTIEPVRPTPLYRLCVALVAVVMLMLPLVYVGFVGLVAYGLYYHAVRHVSLFTTLKGSGGTRVAFVLYVAPLIAGAVAVAFMLKPLFVRPAKGAPARALDPEVEPLLFAFVDGVCASVGAPRPHRIEVDCQVNASARLDGGLFGLFGSDLVLTIGLPLAQGLTLKQFAGVLAHEFGHFAQGAGMRLSVVTWRINVWFARVVYERDRWDEQLAAWSSRGDVYTMVLGGVARGAVWLTRRLLWVLMNVGRGVSGVLSRQMEFDADRYEARMVGGKVFASTCWRLRELNLAEGGAYQDVQSSWQQGKLPDNLPKLIVANVPQIPQEALKAFRKAMGAAKTGFFDTHPSDRDRIEHAKGEEPGEGLFPLGGPATDVFRKFDSLARVATFDLYKARIGPEVNKERLYTVAELVETQTATREGHEAGERFFLGVLDLLQPLPLAWDYPKLPEKAAAAKAALVEAREAMAAGREAYVAGRNETSGERAKRGKAKAALVLLQSGYKIKAADYELPAAKAADAEAARDRAEARIAAIARRSLAPFSGAAAKRLTQALAILEADRIVDALADGRDRREEARVLYTCVAHLAANVAPALGPVIDALGVLGTVGTRMEHQDVSNAMLRASAALRDALEETRWKVGDTLFYPFEHAEQDVTLARFALPADLPDKSQVGDLYEIGSGAVNRLFTLYARALGRIAVTAEEVERLLGLEPIPYEPEPAGEGPADD